jgi:cytoskeletal protein CcmA (bactofilin family)
MFKRLRTPRITTVIGKETQITGDLHFIGGLHIDGSVCGDISATADDLATLTVSEEGKIEGDVRVANILLNGTVIGDIYGSERVELAEKAKVTGTVYYNLLEMAMGAEVNGKLTHSDDLHQRRLGFDSDEETDESSNEALAAENN